MIAISSILGVFAVNITNNTTNNSTNSSNITSNAMSPNAQTIEIVTSGDFSFGNISDVNQHNLSYVNVISNGNSTQTLDLYTKASNNVMNNTNPSITDNLTPLTFKAYNGTVYPYTTTYTLAYGNWTKKIGSWNETINVTVPAYTNNGTYQVIIYNAVIVDGTTPPS